MLTATNTYSGGTGVDGGLLLVNGAVGTGLMAVLAGAVLGGTGTVGGAVTIGGAGVLAGGDANGLGTLTIGSNLTFAGSSATNRVRITGGNQGQYSSVRVTGGNVTLSNAALVLDASGLAGNVDGVIRLIVKSSPGPVDGTFGGPPEGAEVEHGQFRARISYVGGNGNDVVLLQPRGSVVVFR